MQRGTQEEIPELIKRKCSPMKDRGPVLFLQRRHYTQLVSQLSDYRRKKQGSSSELLAKLKRALGATKKRQPRNHRRIRVKAPTWMHPKGRHVRTTTPWKTAPQSSRMASTCRLFGCCRAALLLRYQSASKDYVEKCHMCVFTVV